jgi:catechol 2,3-dioxygenase-like lactoylglutathione lyase family enzyme
VRVKRIDHIVLTVQDVDRAAHWYHRVFGMDMVRREDGTRALEFGEDGFRQRIHLHAVGAESTLQAQQPLPGTADLCLVANKPLADLLHELRRDHVELLLPSAVRREGAMGPTESVYVRDPDGNLIEVADYPHDLRNESFERYR